MRHALNKAVFSFTLKDDGTVVGTTSFSNKKTEVVITKNDAKNNNPLLGATIEIYNQDSVKVAEETTSEDGKITLIGLPVGKYQFKEVAAPIGYALNDTVFEFIIDDDGVVRGVTNITNQQTCVTITKTDLATSEPVAGATIEIYDKNNTVVYSAVTDDSGKILAFALPVGKYTFKETVAPEGYIVNVDSFEFEILKDGSISGVTEFTNEKTKVTITKKNLTTAKPVEGAVVEIYDKKGVKVYAATTDENGEITAFGLPVGKYTFKETIAPDGYKLNTESFEFEIMEDGSVSGTTEFTNERTCVVITKVDETTKAPLEGATITVYNKSGNVVFEGNTDANGTVTIVGIPVGEYTFRETKAPNGYTLNKNEYSFTIGLDGTVEGTTEITNAARGVKFPNTGDDTTVWMHYVLCAASIGLGASLLIRKKKVV